MKQRSIKIPLITFGAFLTLTLIFWGGYTLQVSSQSKTDKTFKAANVESPKITTQFVSEPEWTEFIEINRLILKSQAVVVGVPIDNYCIYSQDNYIVKTVYNFRVDEVTKGNLQAGTTIKVALPGGLVNRGGNTFLNIAATGYGRMKDNSKYLIFLERKNAEEYAPTNGPQGIVEIRNERSAVRFGNQMSDSAEDNERQSINTIDLFREVRGAEKSH